MSGRPVRRRVLADIERAGGWSAVLERIARGETARHQGSDAGTSPAARWVEKHRGESPRGRKVDLGPRRPITRGLWKAVVGGVGACACRPLGL